MGFKKEIGRRIYLIRKSKKINRETLAELINSHANVVGRIERGEIDTGFEKIYHICKVLDIKLTDLYRGY